MISESRLFFAQERLRVKMILKIEEMHILLEIIFYQYISELFDFNIKCTITSSINKRIFTNMRKVLYAFFFVVKHLKFFSNRKVFSTS